MDLKGSLVDANLKIYPSRKFIKFLETMPIKSDIPTNVMKFLKDCKIENGNGTKTKIKQVALTQEDVENLNRIKKTLNTVDINSKVDEENYKNDVKMKNNENTSDGNLNNIKNKFGEKDSKEKHSHKKSEGEKKENENVAPYLTTTDVDWLYAYLQERRTLNDTEIPYLHVLLEGSYIAMPENKTIKRNPVLEERCKKLRAQQEAREYRKMTKGVDNVRMRFPEDSIAYQLKSLNRQLIAIGQFIISIFAGFLFGFRGVEWMVGNLDFGFRLLLGVMCALVIALAEIYFLAKKLNEEFNVPETVQLGGPPKFVNEPTCHGHKIPKTDKKEHLD